MTDNDRTRNTSNTKSNTKYKIEFYLNKQVLQSLQGQNLNSFYTKRPLVF